MREEEEGERRPVGVDGAGGREWGFGLCMTIWSVWVTVESINGDNIR